MIAFIAWQIEQKAQNLSKTTMSKKMHTSRAALASWTRATSLTLTSAAAVLGKKFNSMG